MANFCKSTNCPSSQKLLMFQKCETSEKDARQIRTHISTCEFCAAELEFYTHHPQIEEKIEDIEKAEIPLPLYELAQALLTNRHKDFMLLNKLLGEKESVKI